MNVGVYSLVSPKADCSSKCFINQNPDDYLLTESGDFVQRKLVRPSLEFDPMNVKQALYHQADELVGNFSILSSKQNVVPDSCAQGRMG